MAKHPNKSVPVAPKAKNETKAKAAAAATETETGKSIARIDIASKAISADVGKKVIGLMVGEQSDKDKAAVFTLSSIGKRNQAQALMTEAVAFAAKSDPAFAGLLAYSVTDNKNGKNVCNDAIRVVLGLATVEKNENGKISYPSTQFAKDTFNEGFSKYKKDSKQAKAAETLRGNFSGTLTRAAQTVLGILDMDATVTYDDKSATLLLEGPGVKATYGRDHILLDESKDDTLKVQPTFKKVRELAAANRGQVSAPRAPVTDASDGPTGDAKTSVRAICASLIAAINRLSGEIDPDTLKSMRAAHNALNQKLPDLIKSDDGRLKDRVPNGNGGKNKPTVAQSA